MVANNRQVDQDDVAGEHRDDEALPLQEEDGGAAVGVVEAGGVVVQVQEAAGDDSE